MAQTKLSGAWGEAIAAEYLRKKRYKLVASGYHSRFGEIDLVAQNKKNLVFVEVKTRRQSIQAPPQENVGNLKQSRIAKAALRFLKTRKGLPYGSHECFFDVAAVTFDGDRARLEWFPQAYIPIYT